MHYALRNPVHTFTSNCLLCGVILPSSRPFAPFLPTFQKALALWGKKDMWQDQGRVDGTCVANMRLGKKQGWPIEAEKLRNCGVAKNKLFFPSFHLISHIQMSHIFHKISKQATLLRIA